MWKARHPAGSDAAPGPCPATTAPVMERPPQQDRSTTEGMDHPCDSTQRDERAHDLQRRNVEEITAMKHSLPKTCAPESVASPW
jgi:hypothetical protein